MSLVWIAPLAITCATIARAENPASEGEISTGLSRQMAALAGGFDEHQRDTALYDFGDDERFDLRLAPLGLEGLRIDQMSDAQWSALESMLGEVLSPSGLDKLNTIRSLEREVAASEGGVFGFFVGWLRQVGRYFLTLYGTPATDSAWALRFDGHHLSLNWTVVPNAPLSVTPLFLGGQPRVVPVGLERAGLRVLEHEEERAVEFFDGLSDEERERARIPFESGSAIRRPMSLGGDVDLPAPSPTGLARATLPAESRKRFETLVDVHLGNYAEPIAARLRSRILAPDSGASIVFAAADERPIAGRALYYRIVGGGFMIEFDNTSDEADHIHVVLRQPESDFGRDVLAEHREVHHETRDEAHHAAYKDAHEEGD